LIFVSHLFFAASRVFAITVRPDFGALFLRLFVWRNTGDFVRTGEGTLRVRGIGKEFRLCKLSQISIFFEKNHPNGLGYW